MGTESAADVEQRAAQDRVRELWNRPVHPDDASLTDLGPGSSPTHRGLCTQHGIVVLNELAPNGCPECEAIRAKAGGGPESLQRWAAEVEIPPDAPLVVLVDPEPMLAALYSEFASGYRTELLGVVVPGIPDRREPMAFYGSPLGTVQVWAQHAVHEASGIVSEVRWHPERAPRTAIWNPQLASYSADIEIARRGLELIVHGERKRKDSALLRVGRPLEVTPDAHRRYRNGFVAEHDREPRNTEAAEHFKVDTKTIQRSKNRITFELGGWDSTNSVQ